MIKKNEENIKFIWRVVAAHVIAYFIAGILASQVLYCQDWFLNGVLSSVMRPANAPIVVLGICLQVIRGLIMALVLLPMRRVFIEGKYGFLIFWLLIVGLSVISTFAAAQSSMDGFIYMKISLMEHIIGYPVAILWISLFTGILWVLYKYEKKAINIIAIVLFVLIVLMSTAGYFAVLSK